MIHNPRTCNAFHSAVENVRDNGGEHVGYPSPVTLDVLDDIAHGYVRDGLSECTCGATTATGELPSLDDCPWWDVTVTRRPWWAQHDCGGRMLDTATGPLCENHVNSARENGVQS